MCLVFVSRMCLHFGVQNVRIRTRLYWNMAQYFRLSRGRPGFNSRPGNSFLYRAHIHCFVSFLMKIKSGPVGAMDSALDFESKGCGFESRTGLTFWTLFFWTFLKTQKSERLVSSEITVEQQIQIWVQWEGVSQEFWIFWQSTHPEEP